MENDYQIDGIQISLFQQFMSNFVAKKATLKNDAL